MNIEQVREFTLSLPGVTEDQPFGDDNITFRLEGKIFECLWLGGGSHDMADAEPRFAIKLSPDRNEELRSQFSAVTPAWHWNKKHWNDVYYEQLEDSLIKDLIQESYHLVASKLPNPLRQKYNPGGKWLVMMILFLGLVFTGCSTDDNPVGKSTPWYEDVTTLKADYAVAISEAQTPLPSKVSTTLMPISDSNTELEWITVGDKKLVLVCTMLSESSYKYWQATDTFRLTKQTGIWETIPQEWKHKADKFAGLDSVASRYRMVQMLGLWPECNYNAVVEFYVDPTMLFRPSADPSITTTTSGVDFPSWADEKYTVGETNFREWFAYQKSVAYVGDGACPWTQLGYTYDWHHNADPKGLSEYIATVGALALIKTRQGSWTFIRQNTH